MMIMDWSSFLVPYNQAVEELKVKFKGIRKEYRSRREYSPIEFVTGRVKEVSSIIEKSQRLKLAFSDIDEMEDIAGIRIMCQFVDDIYKVVELIRKRNDMKIVYAKDYINNFKESGYRSYHLILKYPVSLTEKNMEILAEIQVRTLAMNFWATVEHSMNYKYKDNVPDHIKEKLKSASNAAYKLDEEMVFIKEEIKDAQVLFEVRSNLIYEILNNINRLTAHGDFVNVKYYQNKLYDAMDSNGTSELELMLNEIKIRVNKENI